MLEHLESLLTGTGEALDLQTFKLVDQLSGRSMGLRADTTPQVARIDAHLLNRKGVTRCLLLRSLCCIRVLTAPMPRGSLFSLVPKSTAIRGGGGSRGAVSLRLDVCVLPMYATPASGRMCVSSATCLQV